MITKKIIGSFILCSLITQTMAESLTVTMRHVRTNRVLGTITLEDSKYGYGALVTSDLKFLPAGKLHGLHVHENPDCGNMGNNAGGHYDPDNTGTHLGPYVNGHLGDLPVLYVDSKKRSNVTTLAPRIKEVAQLKNRAIIIHEGADTYSDNPPLGGGGTRIACGVIE